MIPAVFHCKAGCGRYATLALKPPGWTPPDIAGVLREQGWLPLARASLADFLEEPRG